MRTLAFILFFAVFLTVYGAANFYVFRRLLSALLPSSLATRWVFTIGFWVVAFAFIAGRVLERIEVGKASTALVWIGSFWIALLIYLVLAAALVDLGRLVHHWVPFLPEAWRADPTRLRRVVALFAVVIAAVTVLAGFVNARMPRVRQLEVAIDKSAPAEELNVVLATDVHLGTLIGRKHFGRIAATINALDPDLILLGGDVIDEDLKPVLEEDLGDTLRTLRARHGVWAITGNHEYIGGVGPAASYLQQHGIRMLRDEVAEVAGLVLVGREDRSKDRFTGEERKPLEALMQGVDRSRPVVLLDHQPFDLDQAERAGADLQLSGHTHNGQLWPFNLVTGLLYEVDWGLLRRGATQYYVSCGVGTWGPPVRLGNTPEIVQLRLRFRSP